MADISVSSILTNACDWLTRRDNGLLTPNAEGDRGRLRPTLGARGPGMALALTPNRAHQAEIDSMWATQTARIPENGQDRCPGAYSPCM